MADKRYPTLKWADEHLQRMSERAMATVALASPTNKGADLSQWCASVLNQYDEGSCTSETTRNRIGWLQNKYGWTTKIDVAVQSIYFFARKIFGDLNQDAGSTVYDAMLGAVQYGLIPANKWLYTNADIYQEPPLQDVVFKAENVQNYPATTETIRSLLEAGEAPGIAVDVQQTLFNPVKYNGMSIVDVGTPVPNAGHAIFLMTYIPDPKYQFLYKCQGSWGTDYGDNGFFWFTQAYLEKCLREVCTVDIPKTSPTPQPPLPHPVPKPQPKPEPKPKPTDVYYELTVGPADEATVQQIETYCSSLHVGVVRKQVH